LTLLNSLVPSDLESGGQIFSLRLEVLCHNNKEPSEPIHACEVHQYLT
jgi:hypothetical protein